MKITPEEVFIEITFFQCVKPGSELNVIVFMCQQNLDTYLKYYF